MGQLSARRWRLGSACGRERRWETLLLRPLRVAGSSYLPPRRSNSRQQPAAPPPQQQLPSQQPQKRQQQHSARSVMLLS
jgi:hypothetical protein